MIIIVIEKTINVIYVGYGKAMVDDDQSWQVEAWEGETTRE